MVAHTFNPSTLRWVSMSLRSTWSRTGSKDAEKLCLNNNNNKKEIRLASSQLASDLTSILDKQEEEKEVLKTIEDSLQV